MDLQDLKLPPMENEHINETNSQFNPAAPSISHSTISTSDGLESLSSSSVSDSHLDFEFDHQPVAGRNELSSKEFLFLPINEDSLIPASELDEFGSLLGKSGLRVHCERLSSIFGHDAFLKEGHQINPRISEFLKGGVTRVRTYVASLYKQ